MIFFPGLGNTLYNGPNRSVAKHIGYQNFPVSTGEPTDGAVELNLHIIFKYRLYRVHDDNLLVAPAEEM